jgi:hypothetical protein
MFKVLVVTGVFCLAAVPAYSQTITEIGDQIMVDQSNRMRASMLTAALDEPDFPLGGAGDIYEYNTLSAGKAFALSLILPGAGQYYTGSKVKAAVSFALEATLWFGRLHYRSQGDTETEEYEAFADAHWNDTTYYDSLFNQYGYDRWDDGNHQWAHHLPFEVSGTDTSLAKNHEYYENIGKYNQFVWGWDDLQQISDTLPIPENNFHSPVNRPAYLVMREGANRSFDRARKATILILANHLLSAFDAALSAQRHNRSAQHTRKISVNVQLVQIRETPTPWVTVAYRF